ncbi:hypothetical protein BDM02DRAFT_3121066 [Thelephora ganbajun]|uniref:Uncharacterized protein n=1 Tax=Thelephora ganbajun TaxID=370292 RepID=A0ACB6Z6C3_THEGA|nr:hypothetical protein BDM02DRAFT_3121066 [Thelephora ganbajun]
MTKVDLMAASCFSDDRDAWLCLPHIVFFPHHVYFECRGPGHHKFFQVWGDWP